MRFSFIDYKFLPVRLLYLMMVLFLLVSFGFGELNINSSSKFDSLLDIDGIRIGHYQDDSQSTGCTVIVFDKATVGGVDVRGSAPGTRETDLLSPINTISNVDAIVLTGGSAFGLDTAGGVMKCLEEDGKGFDTGYSKVPIVPAAVIFDLSYKNSSIRPTFEDGYKACKSANKLNNAQGSVGAGTGATVGKMLDRERSMKGGLGMASIILPDGIRIAALVILNAYGNVLNHTNGQIIAGVQDGKTLIDTVSLLKTGASIDNNSAGKSTTIGIVATNAKFDKTKLTKIAQMAHDGYARSINPVHTPYDGDTIFAVSIPDTDREYSLLKIGTLAAEVMSEAIGKAIWYAKGSADIPDATEFWKQFQSQ